MSAGIQVATAEDVDDCLTNGLDLNCNMDWPRYTT